MRRHMPLWCTAVLMVVLPLLLISCRPSDTKPVIPDVDAAEINTNPLTNETAFKLQESILEHERTRPRFEVTATPADVNKTLQRWGKSVFERDMGTSIVDGGPIQVGDKIDTLLEEPDRRRDLEQRVWAIEIELEKLKAKFP